MLSLCRMVRAAFKEAVHKMRPRADTYIFGEGSDSESEWSPYEGGDDGAESKSSKKPEAQSRAAPKLESSHPKHLDGSSSKLKKDLWIPVNEELPRVGMPSGPQ